MMTLQDSGPITILRPKPVWIRTGYPRATLNDRIRRRLFVRPLKTGPRSAGFPSHEVDALIAATVAGATENELRLLVDRLHAAREFAHEQLAQLLSQSEEMAR